MLDIEDILNFSKAIQWWLSYTHAVEREYILSESSIIVPAADFLGSRGLEEIKLEATHPVFTSRRMDLWCQDAKGAEMVFEFKFIKNSSILNAREKQRIFNDLLRLYFFIKTSTHRRGYFLICGSYLEYTQSFQKLITQPLDKEEQEKFGDGFYTEWFDFEPDRINTSKVIDLATNNPMYSSYCAEFQKEYNTKEYALAMPSTLTTRRITPAVNPSRRSYPSPPPYVIGIWEVIP